MGGVTGGVMKGEDLLGGDLLKGGQLGGRSSMLEKGVKGVPGSELSVSLKVPFREESESEGSRMCMMAGMGVAETLTQSAPMARKVRAALENMMMESVVREDR